jgi:hypothetical protein
MVSETNLFSDDKNVYHKHILKTRAVLTQWKNKIITHMLLDRKAIDPKEFH